MRRARAPAPRRRRRGWRRRTRLRGSASIAATSACSPGLRQRLAQSRSTRRRPRCVSTRRRVADLRHAEHARHRQQRLLRASRLRRLHDERAPGERAGEFVRRAVGDQRAAVEDREAMAALGLVHVVGGDQDRGAGVGELEQLFPEVAARFRIDRAGRFVEEQQFRLVDHRAGQRQALLLAAAQRAGELLLPVVEVVLRDQLVDARLAPAPSAGPAPRRGTRGSRAR